MLTVGCPMSTSPGVPRGPLLLLGWDHTGKPSIPLQAPWHKVFLQAESQSLLAGDESAFLAGKKKKKTQPTTLLFLGGSGEKRMGGEAVPMGGIGLQCLAWGWPRFDVGLDLGAVAPVPCPCWGLGLSLSPSLSPQWHQGSKQSRSHPIPQPPPRSCGSLPPVSG